MAIETRAQLPPFEIYAAAMGLLTPAEMDAIVAAHAPQMEDARMEGGADHRVRRSRTRFLKPEDGYGWLYERLWGAAQSFNARSFGVELTGMHEAIQLARYDGSDQGFYDWHTDFGGSRSNRKISITVQLSDPADYDGGDLEFMWREQPHKAERARGMMIAFPSFLLHRVSPVTRGVRWSLVSWISGPRWR